MNDTQVVNKKTCKRKENKNEVIKNDSYATKKNSRFINAY